MLSCRFVNSAPQARLDMRKLTKTVVLFQCRCQPKRSPTKKKKKQQLGAKKTLQRMSRRARNVKSGADRRRARRRAAARRRVRRRVRRLVDRRLVQRLDQRRCRRLRLAPRWRAPTWRCVRQLRACLADACAAHATNRTTCFAWIRSSRFTSW